MFKQWRQRWSGCSWRYVAIILILLGAWPAPAAGLEYTVHRLTDNNYDDFRPQLNNRGQLVWMADVDRDDYEILFYNQGVTKPVTTNSVKDAFPCLNDAGHIAWLGGYRSETAYLFKNGVKTKISADESIKGTPAISNTGKVVWENPVGNNHDQILQYSTSGLTQIYYEPYGLGFWNVQINGRDQIAWESHDFIYLYTNGVTTKITAKSSRDKYLQLNNRGEMVWSTLDPGGDREIYLYSNGAIKQLSANDYEDFCPEINDAGQVAWLGKVDDQDYEVFLYSNGVTKQLTNNDFDDFNDDIEGYYLPPRLNDGGQVAWLTYEGSSLKVKLYNNGAIQEVFSTDKGLSSLEFNDPSRLAWLSKENYRWEVYLAQPVFKSYQFTCTYSNGDWYTGTVYAGPEQGYAAGKKWSRAVENGLTATYEITKVGPQVTAATIGPGDVYVSSYYDAETKHTFTPLNNTKPLGLNYLGSESGFIKNANVAVYQFGLTWLGAGKTAFLEADVGDTYAFKFSYGNGDYYTGRMYADPFDPKYYPGWKSAYTAKNETGKVGNYEITGVSLNRVAGAEYGKVFVTSYYDGDMSKKVFTSFNATSPLGTAYLGSEKTGYINWNNLAPYAFDRYQEADVGDTYLFKYTYGNGDSYIGRVYAPLTGKYYVGRKLSYTSANETGKMGNYEITGLAYSGAAATDYGKVWVDYYYDGDRTKLQYRPANYSKPLSTLYLGSEKGYIKHEGISAYLFSRYYAADSFDTYNFKYTYGNGDYYLGKVYAAPDSVYYPGWKSAYTTKNETGQVGNYEITGQTYSGLAKSDYGKVFVTTYYDGDASKLSFTPVNTATAMGTSLLGSEKGFIRQDKIKSTSASPYYFARYYEADAGDTYTFRYTYSSNPYFFAAGSTSSTVRYTAPKYTNAAGQAVVASSDAHDMEIFLRSNGVTIQLTNNAYDDKNPQINELGQVVWYGYDGHDYEIFLYSNGVTKQLTNNDFDDSADLKINNAGQVVWAAEIGTVGLTPSRVFLYDKGLVKVISYWGKKVQNVRMNDAGQVVWSESDGIEYDVIFYNNGDTRRLSYWDSSALHPDVSINTNPDISAAGRVVWNGDGLSTEGMCIYLEGSGQQQFLYQSYSYFNDQGQLFSGGSERCFPDSYTGKVYANPKADYYPGWKSAFTKTNENGQVGYYEITGVSCSGVAGTDYGKVFVDSYHDGETNTDVAPAHKGKAVGTNYLASELDYVGANGAAVARFGKNYYEADVADRYTYRYTYGNGDYYQGLVYAAPGSLYYPGYKFTKTNELGLTGTYEILSMLYSGEKTKYGQVFVTTYYNSETKKSYTPVNAIYPKGTPLLGSETGYIISASLSAHYFGKGYYEADE